MRYSFLKTLVFLFAVILGVIFIDSKFFDRKLTDFGPAIVKKPMTYAVIKLENAGFFMRSLARIKNLITENENLKNENLTLISRLADHDDIKNENEFLRQALNMPPRFNRQIIYASIYYFQIGPNGYDALLNKGVIKGISDGDIVITEEGVLVGKIEKAHDNFSRLLAVNDIAFSVAIKVLNSGTTGIAKGALAQGIYLDLIVQNDPIKEGDIVVSSGMDLVPPGLIVGTVSHVELNETDLFKKVKIRPTIGEVKMGRVLVIKRN